MMDKLSCIKIEGYIKKKSFKFITKNIPIIKYNLFFNFLHF